MKKIFDNNDFDNIYWHDSRLISIEFDKTEVSDIKLLIDIVLESHPEKSLNPQENYILIMQPALVKFLFVTQMKINLQWDDIIVEPTLAFITREKSDFTNKIDHTVFYNYAIEFRSEGNILLRNVPDFEMILLGEPIEYRGEDDYIKKRNKILKNNFDLIWKTSQ